MISGGRSGDGNTWGLEYYDPYPGLIHDFLHCLHRFVQVQRICLNDPAYADPFQYLLDTHLGHHFSHHRLSGSRMRLVPGHRCCRIIQHDQHDIRLIIDRIDHARKPGGKKCRIADKRKVHRFRLNDMKSLGDGHVRAHAQAGVYHIKGL